MTDVTHDTPVATDDEMLRYANAYVATSNALGDAILILRRLEDRTIDPGEVLSLMVERRKLEDRYARNERNFLAVLATTIAMHPPAQADVDAIVLLAAEVAQLTLTAMDFRQVVTLATEVADRFDEIQG